MTDEQKIRLADLVLDFVKYNTEEGIMQPVFIGTLNTKQGFNGFKPMEVGTLVYDDGKGYFMMMESLDGKISVQVPYHKETLSRVIDFNKLIQ